MRYPPLLDPCVHQYELHESVACWNWVMTSWDDKNRQRSNRDRTGGWLKTALPIPPSLWFVSAPWLAPCSLVSELRRWMCQSHQAYSITIVNTRVEVVMCTYLYNKYAKTNDTSLSEPLSILGIGFFLCLKSNKRWMITMSYLLIIKRKAVSIAFHKEREKIALKPLSFMLPWCFG